MSIEKNLRTTKQRKQLLELLKSKREPLTADQILKICQLECPNMALTTVYRNLDRMIELGFATKIYSEHGPARFCVAEPDLTILFYCRNCNMQMKKTDYPISALHGIVGKSGFQTEQGYLEVYGLCPHCRKQGIT